MKINELRTALDIQIVALLISARIFPIAVKLIIEDRAR